MIAPCRPPHCAVIRRMGFTLIEMAIVVAILGVVLAAGLQIYGQRLAVERELETRRKMDVIEDALKTFYLVNGRLPYPANGAVVSGNSLGVESSVVTTGLALSNRAYIGVIPSRTLNLPDDVLLDAYGNKFTYVVDGDCCVSWAASCGDTSTTNNISVLDAANTAITSSAVYLLLSHGPNMYGAWLSKSGTRKLAAAPAMVYGTLEALNNNVNYVFRDMLRQSTGTASTHFDDLVRWKTKGQVEYDG